MNIENITNDDIKKEIKFLENKYKIVNEYVKFLLSDIQTGNIFSVGYTVITKMVKDKNVLDQRITKIVSYQDIIKCLSLELNKKYLNYAYVELIENMLTTALSLDNQVMLEIIDEIELNETDTYEKLSRLYNSINNMDVKMNRK